MPEHQRTAGSPGAPRGTDRSSDRAARKPGVARDVLPREDRHRNVFDGAVEGMYRASLSGRLVAVNPALARLLGFDSPEALISEAADATHQPWADADDRSNFLRLVLAQGSPRGYRCRLLRKDGKRLWVSLSGMVECGPDGRPDGVLGFVEDETERREADTAREKAEEELRAVVDSTTDMIWSVDPASFGLRSFNRGLSDHFLRERGMTIKAGDRPEDLFPAGELVRTWRGLYERALLEGSLTADCVAFAGSRVLQIVLSVLSADGVVFGLVVFARDVAEQPRASIATRLPEGARNITQKGSGSVETVRQRRDGSPFPVEVAEAERVHLVAAAERAALEERVWLSRELHDGLAQDLWLAKLKASRLAAISRRRPEAALLARELTDAIDSGLANSRRAMNVLRRGENQTNFSLFALLRDDVEDFSDRFGLPVELTCSGQRPVLLPRAQVQILRIVHEALANVRRHAEATVVTVNAEVVDGSLSVTVHDNGNGFRFTEVPSGRLGLTGMHERAKLLAGSLVIESRPSAGTTVALKVPLSSGSGPEVAARP